MRVRYPGQLGKMNLLIQTTPKTSRNQTRRALMEMIKVTQRIQDRLEGFKIKERKQDLATLLDTEFHLAAGGDSNLRLQRLLSWKSPPPARRP